MNPNIDSIASDIFFPLNAWPSYMVEIFVITNIASYSYNQRNKICLFFWGNGSTIEQMFTLSEMYAPRIIQNTREDRHQYESSKRKCFGLFNTYNENKNNPAYSERYYFYSLIERRMMYINGTPRHRSINN